MKTPALLSAITALMLTASPAAAQLADPAATRTAIDAGLAKQMPDLLALYRDIHQHPEVAFQENRTAALLAARMKKLGFEVTEHVGKTGVVAVYKNGDGPTVMIRTELDALPMEEKTGLPYASRAQQTVDGKLTFVDHACGHDSHMAWWIGTAQSLLAMKDKWHGTLVFVAQPAEEIISGAKAMLADGLYTRFPKPDFAFGAHVGPTPAGQIGVKEGASTSASDTVLVTFHGIGAHGSAPDKSIDPIMIGARFVTDVQTIISREKDPKQFGVITVGSFNAGTVANIIPDHADLQITIRSFDPDVRKLLNEGVSRIANGSAAMAHAPAPTITHAFGAGSVINDVALSDRMAGVMGKALGSDKVTLEPVYAPGAGGSEDYSEFVAAGVPHSVFFWVGGYEPATLARFKAEGKPLPGNHSPWFAPDAEPAIRTGVETLTLAVLEVAGK